MSNVDRRMADAARAEEQGKYRKAVHLYNQLGKDIQAEYGRFDPRALDAFEGVARAIRKGAETDDNLTPGAAGSLPGERPPRGGHPERQEF